MLHSVRDLVCLASFVLAQLKAGPRRPCDTLIFNAVVVTGDDTGEVFAPGAVAVGEGRILGVGPRDSVERAFEARERIDARNGILLPGFVNTRVRAEGVASAALCRYLIECGTTTFVHTGLDESELAASVETAGLRAVLGPVITEKDASAALRSTEAFLKQWKSSSHVVPSAAPVSPALCSWSTLQASRRLAIQYGRPLQIEASRTREEVDQAIARWGRSPILYLEQIGFLAGLPACIDLLIRPDVDFSMIQGVDCVERATERQPVPTIVSYGDYSFESERAILKAFGVAVSLVTRAGRKAEAGTASAADYRRDGVLWTIGTEGNSPETLSLMPAMSAIRATSPQLPAREVLRAATLSGARAIGLGERTGSLEVGKDADLVLIRGPGRRVPSGEELFALIAGALKASDVTDVWASGKRVLRDGKIPPAQPGQD